MYQNFIGIDIGKDSFVVGQYLAKETIEFDNNLSGFKKFFTHYNNLLPSAFVVLEATGGYEMCLVKFLISENINLHRADTRKVKYFIRSFGIQAKTDCIDAKNLARYAFERHARLECFVPQSNEQEELQQLVQRRLDLRQMLVQEKNRLQSPHKNNLLKKTCQYLIDSIKSQMELLETEIEQIIKGTDYEAKQAVLEEIDGIGKITANTLLALLPELGTISGGQVASLVGVAPHPCESGKKIGYRRTKGGRQSVRNILFMSAMTAARSKGRLGEFYRNLINRDKKKMVALAALMRKIIVIANAKMRDWYNEQKLKMVEQI